MKKFKKNELERVTFCLYCTYAHKAITLFYKQNFTKYSVNPNISKTFYLSQKTRCRPRTRGRVSRKKYINCRPEL